MSERPGKPNRMTLELEVVMYNDDVTVKIKRLIFFRSCNF